MKKINKETKEWIILVGVVSILYFTGLHKPVISTIQRLVLETGIMSPSISDEKTWITYDFDLESSNGERVAFSAFKDQVVFINLWATWCPPCIAEMPDIHDLYQKKSAEVAFVMLSLDQDKEKARAFTKNKNYSFPIYHPSGSLPVELSSNAIPTTFVIDKEGKIIVRNEGMAKYDSEKFRNLLDELVAASN